MRTGQDMLQPKDDAIQETQFAGEPSEAVYKDQGSDKEKQGTAEEFDGVQVLPKILIETEEARETEGGEEKRNGKSGGIDGKEKDTASDSVACCSEEEDGGEDRTDARRPAEGKSKAEKEAAPDAGLTDAAAEVDVAVEPACQGWAEEADD